MVPLVKLLIAVTCCITRPIAKCLDKLFGEHHLHKLQRDEIKNVLSIQGTMVGGSGVPLNEKEYLKSVEFWDNNATLK